MSLTPRSQSLWQSLKAMPNAIRQFMASAMSRLFGMNEDNYPATGVQPYEGEPADDKHF
jgi:hypothetical protein